jgi:hypothetical protein
MIVFCGIYSIDQNALLLDNYVMFSMEKLGMRVIDSENKNIFVLYPYFLLTLSMEAPK